MTTADHPPLADGYHDVPAGKLAAVVTCLEMLAAPPARPVPVAAGLSVDRVKGMPLDAYRALFRRIGEPWLWTSRLVMTDAALAAIVHDPDVEVRPLVRGGEAIGLLELDFRVAGECELAFFGVVPEAVGTGVGRWLMAQAVAHAFARPIRRFWVHTCTLDHPAALAFYQRSGFVPYRRQVEIFDDPRLGGVMPPTAAADVPVLPAP